MFIHSHVRWCGSLLAINMNIPKSHVWQTDSWTNVSHGSETRVNLHICKTQERNFSVNLAFAKEIWHSDKNDWWVSSTVVVKCMIRKHSGDHHKYLALDLSCTLIDWKNHKKQCHVYFSPFPPWGKKVHAMGWTLEMFFLEAGKHKHAYFWVLAHETSCFRHKVEAVCLGTKVQKLGLEISCHVLLT